MKQTATPNPWVIRRMIPELKAMSSLNNRSQKLNKKSMKSIVAALVVLCLATISCNQSDEGPQTDESPKTTKSEIQPKRRPGSGVDSSITKVTGLVVKATGPNEIKLTWNSVPDATTYWIYRDDYVPGIVPATNYADKAVKPGTTYTYAIAPVVKSVLGPKSASVTVKTPR